jgi:hypothetical protein
MIAATPQYCRLRIINDIVHNTGVFEVPCSSAALFVDLVKMAREINRRRGQVLKASLHQLADGLIVLHWYCPSLDDELAKAVIEAAAPVYEIEILLWKEGGRQA